MHASTFFASAALLASTALASTPGQAIIINACTYDVYLSAVPSADGGYQQSSHTLSPKDTWTQTWTQLSNNNGWSLKLSKTPALSNVLQYEYTWQGDNTIWYDLSAVDGNPWDANWQISSTSPGCTPKHSWYRDSTDDAFGMQDCTVGSSVTVTLCSAENQADSIISQIAGASSAGTTVTSVTAAQSPATTAQQTTTTQQTTPTTTATQAHTTAQGLGYENGHFNNKAVVEAPSPTTFATSTTAAVVDNNGDVVTEVVTVIETAVAYETYVPGKRHVHHPNHPHFR